MEQLWLVGTEQVMLGLMTISIGMITVDTTDSRRLAQWWCERLDGRLEA